MGGVVRAIGKAAGILAAVLPGPWQVAAIAVSIGSQLLFPGKQTAPQSATQLGRLQARLDPQAPRKLVLGPRTAMPVDIRYYEGSGEDEEFIDYIAVVAAHRIGSIDEIWFEDALAWKAIGGVQGDYVGYLTTVATRLEGTSANTIAINGGANWGADDRLTGCAYVHLRIKRTGNSEGEQSPLASGIPGRVTIIGAGMPNYDPRFDSTAGGSGTQRPGDQSTWGPASGNLIIQANSVLLGWRIGGKLSVGAGLPPKYLDFESAITGANICDEAIVLAGGGTQPRYHGAGAFSTDDAPMNIVAALLAGCAGDLLDSEGRLSFLIKTNTLAVPVVEFDDHDVLGGVTWDPMGGQTNVPNIISGSYTDPSNASLYQMVPYPSVSLPSEDDIERTAPLDLGVIEDAARAERLAKQTLQRMQYTGIFTAEYNMKGMAALVGKIVWQTYSPLGFLDKPFRVVNQKPSRSGRIALLLREEHEGIYAWAAEDSASVVVAAPVGFDPRNTTAILLARQAGKTADWSAIVDDGGKPADNATRNDAAGNLIPSPVTLDRATVIGPLAVENIAVPANGSPQEKHRIRFAGDGFAIYEPQGSTLIKVVPGETLYIGHLARAAGGGSGATTLTAQFQDAAGGAAANIQVPGTTRTSAVSPNEWLRLYGKVVVPPDKATLVTYAHASGVGVNEHYTALPFISRFEPGSTEGAPEGTNVAATSATIVALGGTRAALGLAPTGEIVRPIPTTIIQQVNVDELTETPARKFAAESGAQVNPADLAALDAPAATKLGGIAAGAQVNPADLAALDAPAATKLGGIAVAADVTANQQITLSDVPPFTIQASSAGQTTTAFPVTRQIMVFRGGVQVTSGVTVGTVAASPAAAITSSATVSGGVVTVSLSKADVVGNVVVPVTLGGITYDKVVLVNRNVAVPIAGGSSGSTQFIDSEWTNISTTSAVQVTDAGAEVTASAAGALDFSLNAGYQGEGTATITAEYRVKGSTGGWTQAFTENGSPATVDSVNEPGEDGFVLGSASVTGLTGGGAYEVRLTAARTAGTGELSWQLPNFTAKQP